MKKQADHIVVRPSYFRSNFDYVEEGPYSRVTTNDGIEVSEDELVVDPEELEKIKLEDLNRKRKYDMKEYSENVYPDPAQKAEKNELFKQTKEDYAKQYTTRQNYKTAAKKEAVIRGDTLRECPFGLPIPHACKYAGKAIHRMAPLNAAEDERGQKNLKKANELVYINHKSGYKCPFADKILANHKKVDCDYGDTGEGENAAPFRGSPLYPSTFTGIGFDGLYGHPLGFYSDRGEARNMFYGLYSLVGKKKNLDTLVKLAYKYEESGELEVADKLDQILEDLRQTEDREELDRKFDRLERMLDQYKEKYEQSRTDSGYLYNLADSWFGPRSVNV